MARSVLTIYLDQYRDNLQAVKQRNPHVRIMAVVKANAYGLGLCQMAEAAQKNGVNYLGVAQLSEGVLLRKDGRTLPILLLSEPFQETLEDCVTYTISVTVFHEDMIDKLIELSHRLNAKIRVHLKVDTGMTRLGCNPKDVVRLAAKICESSHLIFEGLFTHFSSADDPNSGDTEQEFARFEQCIEALAAEGFVPELYHCANSGGIEHFPETWLDMVRFGLGSYANCVHFSTWIMSIKWVESGVGISYGGDYVTERATRIAVLPVGYADGVPRCYGNNGGEVVIAGRRYPIVGRVCMDMCMVDLGPDDHLIKTGDPVFILNDEVTVAEMAQKTQHSSYEILCGIGHRVERVYKNG